MTLWLCFNLPFASSSLARGEFGNGMSWAGVNDGGIFHFSTWWGRWSMRFWDKPCCKHALSLFFFHVKLSLGDTWWLLWYYGPSRRVIWATGKTVHGGSGHRRRYARWGCRTKLTITPSSQIIARYMALAKPQYWSTAQFQPSAMTVNHVD